MQFRWAKPIGLSYFDCPNFWIVKHNTLYPKAEGFQLSKKTNTHELKTKITRSGFHMFELRQLLTGICYIITKRMPSLSLSHFKFSMISHQQKLWSPALRFYTHYLHTRKTPFPTSHLLLLIANWVNVKWPSCFHPHFIGLIWQYLSMLQKVIFFLVYQQWNSNESGIRF